MQKGSYDALTQSTWWLQTMDSSWQSYEALRDE